MKCAPILLLMAFCTATDAGPIYHCEDSSGRVVFQDTPCAGPVQTGDVFAQGPTAVMVFFNASEYGQNSWNPQQTKPRRLYTKMGVRAETLRLRALQQPLADLKTANDTENHRRCQNAMQVAALCGKFAGKFYCDEKGFRPLAITEISTRTPPVINNGNEFKMTQCALQAARGD